VERSSGAAPPRPSGEGDQANQTERELLAIEVERLGDGVSIVVLVGELDLATMPKLEDLLFDELRANDAVILDLMRLTFIDSSGIGLLIKAHRSADGGELRTIVSRGSQVERIFNLVGIDRALHLFVDRGTAIAALDGGSETSVRPD
jgi:anti-anti-sigma factor